MDKRTPEGIERQRKAASEWDKKRWANISPEERKAHAVYMNSCFTPEIRKEAAKKRLQTIKEGPTFRESLRDPERRRKIGESVRARLAATPKEELSKRNAIGKKEAWARWRLRNGRGENESCSEYARKMQVWKDLLSLIV